MPEPLLESAPFCRELDQNLERLLGSIRAALEPDGVELNFTFHGDGRPYRRTFATNLASLPRQARREERPGGAEPGFELRSPFQVPRLLDGEFVVYRRGLPFTDVERGRFGLLEPLLSHLLELLARVEVDADARHRLLAAAERTDAPILIFNGDGSIVFANESADELLSRQTEEALTVIPESDPETPLLSFLLGVVSQTPLVPRHRVKLLDGRCLEVRVSPDADDPSMRVVTVHERASQTLDDVMPRLLHLGVSERETEVIGLVLKGMRNAEIAGDLCISEYTVKDHLKHVFAKVGVTSRGGLVEWIGRAQETTVPVGR